MQVSAKHCQGEEGASVPGAERRSVGPGEGGSMKSRSGPRPAWDRIGMTGQGKKCDFLWLFFFLIQWEVIQGL